MLQQRERSQDKKHSDDIRELSSGKTLTVADSSHASDARSVAKNFMFLLLLFLLLFLLLLLFILLVIGFTSTEKEANLSLLA